jgi:heme A synthase
MSTRANKAVVIWLFTVAALVGLMIVVFGVPIWLALLHQATALLMFATAVYLNHRLAWAARE